MTDLPGWLAASHAAANPRANTQSAAGRLSQPRPVPYRNDRAPRPLPRTMRPPEARANDPRLAWDEQSRALAELQRNRDMGRTALEGQAQAVVDPEHTPLENGVLGVGRAFGPGAAYDAVRAGGRIAGGDNSADAWGGLALNTGIAALPFLGLRGLRGEPAPAPMREPAPSSEMGPMVNDLDQWIQGGMPNTRREMLPELIRRQRSIDGSYGGVRPDNTVSMNDLIDIGRDPERAPFLPEALNDHLGEFGALGERGAMPLLGSPDIAADPLANPTRPGLPRNAQPPWMRAPNEDARWPGFGTRDYRPLNERGHPVATEQFPFGFRPNPREPNAVDTEQFYPVVADPPLYDRNAFRNEDVPTSSLTGTQRYIRDNFLNPERPGDLGQPISVSRTPDGTHFIVNGHHRAAAAIARGEPTIPANVHYNADPPAEAPRPVTPDAGSVRDGQFNTDEVLYRGDGNNVGQQEGENAFWYTPHRATAAEFGPNITAAHVRGRLHVFDAGGRSYEDINVPQILDSARGQGFAGVRFRNMLDEAIHDSSNAPYPDYVAMFDRSNVHPVAPDGGGAGAPTATERYPFGFRPVSDEPWAQSRLRTDQFYPVDTARDYGDAVHAPEIAPTDVPVDSLVGTQESIGSRFLNRPSTGNEPVSVYRAEDGQMYIIDGHHRVAGAVARGEPTVSARVYSPENPPINTREPEIQAALDARLRPEFDGGQWHIVENGQRLRTLPQGTTARDAMRAADEMRSARTPPPTDPKSLPRRKPPSGGFTVFGAPR